MVEIKKNSNTYWKVINVFTKKTFIYFLEIILIIINYKKFSSKYLLKEIKNVLKIKSLWLLRL